MDINAYIYKSKYTKIRIVSYVAKIQLYCASAQ